MSLLLGITERMKGMGKVKLVLVAFVFVGSFGSFASGQISFQGLGISDWTGGDYGQVNLILGDGSAVYGGFYNSTGQTYRPFRWTQSSGFETFPMIPEFESVDAFGISAASADGSVLFGLAVTVVEGIEVYESFRWSEEDGVQIIGGYPQHAYDVSADGSIAVNPYAGIWTDTVGWEDVEGGYGFAISADGSVVTGYEHVNTAGIGDVWSESSGWQDIGDIFGLPRISADGLTVVGASWVEGMEAIRPFRWTEAEGMQLLSTLNSTALSVSGDGSVIIGIAEFSGITDNFEVFVWDADRGFRNLQAVLENDFGLDLTGWKLTESIGMSDDGLTIIGKGINPDGDEDYWIAMIPEPVTLLLLGLGGLIIRKR